MSASTSGCSAAAAAIRSLTADRDLHSTCWSLLGLPTSSEVPEVTRAYRRLSLLVHPDKAPEELADKSHEAFQNLSVAFQQALKYSQARAANKQPRAQGGGGGDAGAGGGSSGSGGGGGGGGGEANSGFAHGEKEWWKRKKPWEIDEMIQKLEEEYGAELAAEQQAAMEARERKAARQQERHRRVAEAQEAWLEDAEAGAEGKRSSWQAFVSSGRKGEAKRRRKESGSGSGGRRG